MLRAYDPAPTRSELERRFLHLCREHHLGRPEVNALIDGYLVDFLWRDRRLIAEVGGSEYHRVHAQFEHDREQDVTLATNGWGTLRFTWRQITRNEAWVAAAVRTGAPARVE